MNDKIKFLMSCISGHCEIASVHEYGIGKTVNAEHSNILQCMSLDNDIRVVKKSINNITNEEAKELYLILNFTSRIPSINNMPHISVIKSRIKTFFSLKSEDRGFSYHPIDVIKAYDYVRDRGYAVYWNGISVQEQIDLKWIIIIDK